MRRGTPLARKPASTAVAKLPGSRRWAREDSFHTLPQHALGDVAQNLVRGGSANLRLLPGGDPAVLITADQGDFITNAHSGNARHIYCREVHGDQSDHAGIVAAHDHTSFIGKMSI